MVELKVNLWKCYRVGNANGLWWVGITTNSSIRNDGRAVMGRGCAKEATDKFPLLQKELGHKLYLTGNHVYAFREYRIFTFPVKHRWNEIANITLIKRSANELMNLLNFDKRIRYVFLPRPGCGNGKLQWSEVRKNIEKIFDDRVIIVSFPKEGTD